MLEKGVWFKFGGCYNLHLSSGTCLMFDDSWSYHGVFYINEWSGTVPIKVHITRYACKLVSAFAHVPIGTWFIFEDRVSLKVDWDSAVVFDSWSSLRLIDERVMTGDEMICEINISLAEGGPAYWAASVIGIGVLTVLYLLIYGV